MRQIWVAMLLLAACERVELRPPASGSTSPLVSESHPATKPLAESGERTRFGPIRSLGSAKAIALASTRSCVLRSTGKVHCWGRSHQSKSDRVPDVRLDDTEIPLPAKAKQILNTKRYTCAVSDAAMHCWGTLKRQYSANLDPAASPRNVKDFGGMRSVAAGAEHICGLKKDGRTVICFGDGSTPLGVTFHNRKYERWELKEEAVSIHASAWSTCALGKDATLRCWGAGRANVIPVATDVRTVYSHFGAGQICYDTKHGSRHCFRHNGRESPPAVELNAAPETTLALSSEMVCQVGKAHSSCLRARHTNKTLELTPALAAFPKGAISPVFGTTYRGWIGSDGDVSCAGDTFFEQCGEDSK